MNIKNLDLLVRELERRGISVRVKGKENPKAISIEEWREDPDFRHLVQIKRFQSIQWCKKCRSNECMYYRDGHLYIPATRVYSFEGEWLRTYRGHLTPEEVKRKLWKEKGPVMYDYFPLYITTGNMKIPVIDEAARQAFESGACVRWYLEFARYVQYFDENRETEESVETEEEAEGEEESES